MSARRLFQTLWRREVKAAYSTLSSWMLVAGYAAVVGTLLLFNIWKAEGTVQTVPILFAISLVAALPPLTAFATMQSFAGERQRGTLEGLLANPIPDSAVVLAKFAGAYVFVILAIAAAIGGLAVYAETVSHPIDYSRTGTATAIAMVLLHAASFTAFGILVSVHSRHPAESAIVTALLTFIPTLLICGTLIDAKLPDWFNSLDIRSAARGLVDTRPVVLALSTLALHLFAATRALESRRWSL